MTFDPTRPVQTRDGRPARIVATDRHCPGEDVSIVALVKDKTGTRENVLAYRRDGLCGSAFPWTRGSCSRSCAVEIDD